MHYLMYSGGGGGGGLASQQEGPWFRSVPVAFHVVFIVFPVCGLHVLPCLLPIFTSSTPHKGLSSRRWMETQWWAQMAT